MTTRRWVELNKDTSIAFDIGCTGEGRGFDRYGTKQWVSWDLLCKGYGPHGHVCIGTEDGTCRMQFPCASIEGVRKLLSIKNWVTDDEREGILNLDEVRTLPMPITSEEQTIFDDPLKLEEFTTDHFFWP